MQGPLSQAPRELLSPSQVVIRRRPLFYAVSLLLPSIFLMVMDIVGFYLPPDSGERVSFKITLLLGYSVFLIIVSDTLPATAIGTPLIGKARSRRAQCGQGTGERSSPTGYVSPTPAPPGVHRCLLRRVHGPSGDQLGRDHLHRAAGAQAGPAAARARLAAAPGPREGRPAPLLRGAVDLSEAPSHLPSHQDR